MAAMSAYQTNPVGVELSSYVNHISNRAFSIMWPLPAAMQFIGTKESFHPRKEFNSHRICLVHRHDRLFIVLKCQLRTDTDSDN